MAHPTNLLQRDAIVMMDRRGWPVAVCLAFFGGGAILACRPTSPVHTPPAGSQAAGKVWRVAMLHPGRETDRGWNQLAYEALQSLGRRDDVRVKNLYAPNRSNDKADLRALAEQGYDLVICHGSEFVKPAREVAPQFPKTRFAVTGSDEAGQGVATIDFRLWEATYLCGVLAAKVSPEGPAGLIGGEDFRTVRHTLDAFANGARSVKPDYPVHMQYVGSWDDVARARQTAESLIAGYKVRVIFQNCDAAAFGVFDAARAAGGSPPVYVFGSNRNQNDAAPELVPASAVIDMGEAFSQLVDALAAGEFEDRAYTHDLKSGGIRFVVNEGLKATWPAEVNVFLDEIEAKIKAGALDVLASP
jgi:basic membrane lipoprotein Med (substrate-binding protein (PBP1-ABC) superfamily)